MTDELKNEKMKVYVKSYYIDGVQHITGVVKKPRDSDDWYFYDEFELEDN